MKRITKKLLLLFAMLTLLVLMSSAALAGNGKAQPELQAENVKSAVQLQWTACKNASFYGVFRKEAKEKKPVLIAKTKTTKYNDKDVKGGSSYYYAVMPFTASGKSGQSSNNVYITRLAAPKIKNYTNTEDGIKLVWSGSKGATGYLIYRRNESSTAWKRIGKTDSSASSFIDKNVTTKGKYVYMLKAYCENGTSYQSGHKKADFLKTPEINKISSNKASLSIKWTATPKASYYEIYRIEEGKKTFEMCQRVKAGKLSFTDKDVKKGKKYGYTVRAVDKNKKVSGHKTAVYCVLMKMPEIKSVTNTSDGIKLTWSKTPSAEGYSLYRRDIDGSTWKRIALTKSLSATDTTAKNGKKYVYTVRAVYNGVQSVYSTQGAEGCFLSAPSGVKTSLVNGRYNKISWKKNPSATNYNVYRRADGSDKWTRITRTAKTAFTDKTAKAGKTYQYFVRAYIKADFKSAASRVVLSSTVKPNKKLIALTYDDGPSIYTDLVLDTLEKYDARATFFVLGSQIDYNHEALERAVRIGCEIGNHSYSHVDYTTIENSEIESELKRTNNLVKKYTGFTPVLARAPYGSTNKRVSGAVNMPFIYWSVDTMDWDSLSATRISNHIKQEACDGAIILMHDLYRSTADATAKIVPWLIDEGYELVTVSEMMHYRGISLKNGVTYYAAYPD